MTTFKFIITGFILIFIACNQKSNKTTVSADVTNSSIAIKDTTTPNTQSRNFEYIIFGRYCRMCGGECATMYKLDRRTNQLKVDHSDSYFKSYPKDSIIFNSIINDKSKIEIAEKIIQFLPDSLNILKESKKTFGCPDCKDGCGMYFEFFNSSGKKSFYIDYQIQLLPDNYIKTFAEHLKTIIEAIEK